MRYLKVPYACVLAGAVGLILAAGPLPASAQPIPNNVLEQQQRIERDRRQREKQEELRRELERNQPPAIVPDAAPLEDRLSSEGCIDIVDVDVQGARLFDARQLQRWVAPLENTCATLADIDAVLRQITNAYVERGYVTSRAAIAPDAFREGVLVILILEGLLEDLEFGDDDPVSRRERALAFPGLVGETLNIRDIEQGLDQLNRLASNNASSRIEPGQFLGGSKIVIDNERSFPLHATATRSNDGDESTGGIWRQDYRVRGDSLLGLNELLTLGFAQNEQDANSPGRSETYSGSISVPYGYWTFDFNSSYNTYQTTFESSGTVFEATGHSRVNGVGVDYVFHRDAVSKSTLSASLDHRIVSNRVDDVALATSTYTMASVGGGLSHSRRLLGGVLSASFTVEHGIEAFGATRDDPADGPTFPKAQFELYEATLDVVRPFEVFGVPVTYTGSFLGQYAPTALFSARQIVLGGEFSVRGFEDQTVSGKTGMRLRQELATPMPVGWPQPFDTVLPVPELLAFYDHGYVSKGEQNVFNGGKLSGYGVGLRMRSTYLTVDAIYARPHQAPASIDKRNSSVYLRGSLQF